MQLKSIFKGLLHIASLKYECYQVFLGFNPGDSNMQIEDYFNFLVEDDIRIKGTRIGIESVLYEYIYNGKTAKEIDQRFHTVTLEQVYATILYFLQNQQKVSAYFADYLEYCRKAREE